MQVIKKTDAFLHILFKCRIAAICNDISHCVANCVVILPELKTGSQTWQIGRDVKTVVFLKVLLQMKI